jgi:hypothetical protein
MPVAPAVPQLFFTVPDGLCLAWSPPLKDGGSRVRGYEVEVGEAVACLGLRFDAF